MTASTRPTTCPDCKSPMETLTEQQLYCEPCDLIRMTFETGGKQYYFYRPDHGQTLLVTALRQARAERDALKSDLEISEQTRRGHHVVMDSQSAEIVQLRAERDSAKTASDRWKQAFWASHTLRDHAHRCHVCLVEEDGGPPCEEAYRLLDASLDAMYLAVHGQPRVRVQEEQKP